jgi:hypothetical protein
VHLSPRIIKLAVPAFQHSPLFGQLPLEQMVFNLFSAIKLFNFEKFSPLGNGDFIQAGNRSLTILFSDIIKLYGKQTVLLKRSSILAGKMPQIQKK